MSRPVKESDSTAANVELVDVIRQVCEVGIGVLVSREKLVPYTAEQYSDELLC